MNQKFAEWYEIAQISADHEILNRRWQAVEKVVENLEPAAVYGLTKAYHGLTNGEEQPDELIAAIREFDSAFVVAGRQAEVGILAAAVLNEVLSSDSDDTSDLTALAVLVPALQGLRKAPLIPELLSSVEQYLASRSAELRKPDKQSMFGSIVPNENVEGVIQALKDNQPPQAAEHLNKVIDAQAKIMLGQASRIEACEKRLMLLREESDILWWLTGSHSRTLNRSFGELEIGCASLLAGRELADLTHIVPGPLAISAFARKMLVAAFGESTATTGISLSVAINAVPIEVRRSWRMAADGSIGVELCPLHNGVIHSLSVEKPSEWAPLFNKSQAVNSKTKCAPHLLSRQLYLESLLLRAGI